MTEKQKKLALLACLSTIILAILDQNIVSAATVPIVRDLDPVHGLARLPWLLTTYALAATAALPLYGKLCDVYGAKRVFLAAVLTFLGGSALCGTARTMTELIAFRAVQGIGGGGLMSVTMVVVALLAGPERRGRAGGLGGLIAGLAMVVGPMVGGLLVDHAGWRWIFFVNLPLGAVVVAVAAAVLRLPTAGHAHRIDYPGAALAAAGAVTIMLVTEWGGQRYPWGSPVIVGLALAAALLLGLFLWRERTAVEPILPPSLFAHPVLRAALSVQFLSGAAMLGSIVYVMVYLQAARGVPASRAGFFLIPMALGMSLAGTVAGRLRDRGWPVRRLLVSGTGCAALATGLLGTLRVDSSWWTLATALFALGAGLGQLLGLLILVAQDAAPAHQLGAATTAVRFVQTLGGAFGAALFGTILTRGYGGTAALGAPHRDLAALVSAIDTVFLCAAGVLVVAVALAALIRPRSVRRPSPPAVAVAPEPVAR